MTESETEQAAWEAHHREELAHWKIRPRMYVGALETAHIVCFRPVLQLLWHARVFRNPGPTEILLGDNQFVIRAEAGPLVRPIQRMHTWGGDRTLSARWGNQRKAYFAPLWSKYGPKGTSEHYQFWRPRWRYCFTGPTGPRLESPSNLSIAANRLTWGLKTDAGLWCETYEGGWPQGKPFLVEKKSRYGVIVIGDLPPEYFTGLPYTAEDVQQLLGMSGKRVDRGDTPLRYYQMGEIRVELRSQPLLSREDFSQAGVLNWL